MRPVLRQLSDALLLGARICFNHDPNRPREYYAQVWMPGDPDPIFTENCETLEACILEACSIAQGGDD